MKRLLLLGVVLALIAAAYFAGSHRRVRNAASDELAETHKVLYYVDPMNPAHTSDQPGKAPCGMDMEPVYAETRMESGATAQPASIPQGLIRISPEKQQLIGVRLATAEKKALAHKLRLLGKVATDETRIYRINATVDGWITRALPFAAGSQVKKDETLAQFYSPEFLAAAQSLLFALTSADRARPTGQENEMQRSMMANFDLNLKQSRDGLRNLGMGEVQIEELIRTRARIESVNITSPTDGFILLRNVSDGQRFDKGTELFRIADLSHVWIVVDVFERDARLVQSDQPLKVELSNQGRTFTATVSKTLPQFDNISRTLKLRLEAENPDYILKPDMFVDVELPLGLPEAVVVPADAVLDAGLRQTVYVDKGNGYFEPRNISVGSRVGDQVQVMHGLEAGERIVTSGNFLLDSESRMKLAASGLLSAPVTDPACGMAVDAAMAKAAGRTSEYQGKTYSFCSVGCKKNFDADPARYLPKTDGKPAAPKAVESAEIRDPVCGMTVDLTTAAAEGRTFEFQGRTYYFCADACRKRFVAAPEKFISTAR